MRETLPETMRATVFIRGRVQGVGLRWWVRARALELGLAGHARNTDDGRVEVVIEGDRADIHRLITLVTETPSTHSRPGDVVGVSSPLWSRPRGETDFAER